MMFQNSKNVFGLFTIFFPWPSSKFIIFCVLIGHYSINTSWSFTAHPFLPQKAAAPGWYLWWNTAKVILRITSPRILTRFQPTPKILLSGMKLFSGQNRLLRLWATFIMKDLFTGLLRWKTYGWQRIIRQILRTSAFQKENRRSPVFWQESLGTWHRNCITQDIMATKWTYTAWGSLSGRCGMACSLSTSSGLSL